MGTLGGCPAAGSGDAPGRPLPGRLLATLLRGVPPKGEAPARQGGRKGRALVVGKSRLNRRARTQGNGSARMSRQPHGRHANACGMAQRLAKGELTFGRLHIRCLVNQEVPDPAKHAQRLGLGASGHCRSARRGAW